MNLLQIISGAFLLLVACALSYFAIENRALPQRVYAPQQQISAELLAQWGPQNNHAVRVTNFDWGTPFVDRDLRSSHISAVWIPLFPKSNDEEQTFSDLDDPRPPQLLFHSTQPRLAEHVQTILDQASVTGVVVNGLPLWKTPISPQILARWPGVDANQVLLITDEPSRWPAAVLMAGIMAFTCGMVGVLLISNAVNPSANTDDSLSRKHLPLLAIPEQLRSLPPTGENLSRTFFHPQCQKTTHVEDDDLVLLECPFHSHLQTFCSGCERLLTLDQLYWSDTGENILEYRQRLLESVPIYRRIFLTHFATPYAGALNLGLNARGEHVDEVGLYTFPPHFLEALDEATRFSQDQSRRTGTETGHELIHAPQNLNFGPLTVNEFGLELRTPEGPVTAVWDDVQNAELSQGKLVIELAQLGNSTVYRIPAEEIPNIERFLLFLAEVAPVGAVIA